MKTTGRRAAATAMAFILSYAMVPALSTKPKASVAFAASAPFVLPSGREGAEYSYRFNSEGGLAPLTWRVVQGELPPGLALQPTGTLSGLPALSRRQAYDFAVEVADSSDPPQRFQQGFTLTINAAALRILPASSTLKIVTSKQSDASAASSHQEGTATTGPGSASSGGGSNAGSNSTPGETGASAGNRSDAKADQPNASSPCIPAKPDPSKKDAGAATTTKIHPIITGMVTLASMGRGKLKSAPVSNVTYKQMLRNTVERKLSPIEQNQLFLLEHSIANLAVHIQDPGDSNKLIATGFTKDDGGYTINVPKDGIDPKEYVISTEGDDFITRRTVFIGDDCQPFTVNLALEDRPIGLLHRAIVGFEQSASSSLDSKQKFFFDLFLSMPVPFLQQINPDFGGKFRIWGDTRITSVPQRINTGVAEFAANFATNAGNVPVNQIAQGLEFVAGAEFRLTGNTDLLPGFDRDTRNKYSLSLIAGFGATTPMNPRDTAEVFKITPGAPGLPPVPAGTQYIAFVSSDRDRFFRQYFAGFRLQTYYFNRFGVPRQRFPGMLDITYGINEYVTGGRAHGGVFRLDGFFPLPFDGLKFINLFGTAYLRPVRSKITTPLVLEPAPAGTTVPGPDVFVALAPQIKRDYYRIGAGIDFISFIQALKNKNNNK